MAFLLFGCCRRFANGMPEWFQLDVHILGRGGRLKGSNPGIGLHDWTARVIWSAASASLMTGFVAPGTTMSQLAGVLADATNLGPKRMAERSTIGESELSRRGKPRLVEALRSPGEVSGIIAGVGNTDFPQAISLFHTRDRRREAEEFGKSGKELPAVSANRQALPNLPLDAYKK